MTISEVACLQAVIQTGKAPPGGFWLGGLKYSITQYDAAFESGDSTIIIAFANRPKKGVHIACAGSQVICGLYDEEKGQTSGAAKKAVLDFAEYLQGAGY